MDRSRDKLGEYVMIAEEFNRYEEFATEATDYATLDEATPSGNHQGAFDLYQQAGNPLSDERRGIIHSRHVYGKTRPVDRIVFEIKHSESNWSWHHTITVSPGGEQTDILGAGVELQIRPVLTDFDPAAATWNAAYVTGGGYSYGTPAVLPYHVFHKNTTTLYIIAGAEAGAQTIVLIDGEEIPNLFPPHHDGLEVGGAPLSVAIPLWNALDAIYGWEFQVWTQGETGEHVQWVGELPSTCYVILS